MATFNVCDTVTVPPGGSFTWRNPFTQPVTITPEGTWFLPESSIIIPAGASSVPVSIPATVSGTYNLSVTFPNGANACPGKHQKIIVASAN